jgi:glycosyltransferase involved in cell wall biosynthesis
VSNAVVTASHESFPLQSERAFVIGHGIDVHRLEGVLPRSEAHEPAAIGVAGRITPFKGLLTVVEAIGVLRDRGSPVDLHVAGVPFYPSDHAYLAGVHNCVRDLGLVGSIHFRGAVPGSEMVDFYSDLDLFVAWRQEPALDKTGLEALASGTLLVTNNPAYRESLGLFAKDFLVESSPQALADGIGQALALHPNLKLAAIKQLRTDVIERHSADRLAARLVEVFVSLREHHQPPFPSALVA